MYIKEDTFELLEEPVGGSFEVDDLIASTLSVLNKKGYKTACPGNWLYSRLGKLADEVTKQLGSAKTETKKDPVKKTEEKGSFKVKVDITDLNIRKGPGTNYAKTGKYTGKGTFTIVEEKSGKGSVKGWGKLKSGAGWIALDYAKRM